FFFSSRRRHTRSKRDWSSDVCSSDLENVIVSLADKITHFHLHNNDGLHDDHNRIKDGSLNFDEFITLHQKHAPDADLVLEYNYDIGYETDKIAEDINYLKEKFNL